MLVDELREELMGAIVRRVEVDRAASVLALRTHLSERDPLVVSFSREAPGLYQGDPPGAPVPSTNLKNRLVGARLVDVSISALDRIMTLTFVRTRLSGRRQGVVLVLEVMGARVALFVLDLDSRAVIEAFGPGRKRVAAGKPWEAPDPPPGAAPLAEDEEEFERRLEAEPGDLLAASGATPLIVTELRWTAKHEGIGLAEAFGNVRRRLRSPRPFLYGTEGRFVASPIALASRRESAATVLSFESFNDAMSEAVRLAWERGAFERSQARLLAAVKTASAKLARLRDKLEREDARVGEPETLRRSGELLLAGLGRARRLRDGAVLVPDAFDPSRPDVEVDIDPRLGLPANAEKYFRRARKQERAREALGRRRSEIESREESLATLDLAIRDAESLAGLDELEGEAAELNVVPVSARETKRAGARRPARLGPRRYVTSRGSTVLVGRSSRGNDELTFKRAQPDDVWLHASGRAGAHVVLKVEPGRDVSEDEILEAAALAAFYSKGREDTFVEVMVTRRKNVSKLKGLKGLKNAPPGAVRVKEHRAVRVAPVVSLESLDTERSDRSTAE